jgi:hypothetical protein
MVHTDDRPVLCNESDVLDQRLPTDLEKLTRSMILTRRPVTPRKHQHRYDLVTYHDVYNYNKVGREMGRRIPEHRPLHSSLLEGTWI